MRTFKTNDGTEWRLSVNVGTVKRCLEETGLRLTDLFASEGKIAEFFSDDLKFAEVLWSLVGPQAAASGKNVDDFFQAIDGTVIEAAAEALLAEIVDFFQEPRRTLLRRVLEKYQAAATRLKTEAFDVVNQRLETTNFEEILKNQISNQPTRSSSATSSPVAAA